MISHHRKIVGLRLDGTPHYCLPLVLVPQFCCDSRTRYTYYSKAVLIRKPPSLAPWSMLLFFFIFNFPPEVSFTHTVPKEDALGILLCPNWYKMVVMKKPYVVIRSSRTTPRASRGGPHLGSISGFTMCASSDAVALATTIAEGIWVQHGENDRARVHAVGTIIKEGLSQFKTP